MTGPQVSAPSGTVRNWRVSPRFGPSSATANKPPLVQMKAMSGPRHIVMSPDNKFAFLLNELVATVTTLSLDAATGLLTEVSSASALPADTKLVPGAPRGGPSGRWRG